MNTQKTNSGRDNLKKKKNHVEIPNAIGFGPRSLNYNGATVVLLKNKDNQKKEN